MKKLRDDANPALPMRKRFAATALVLFLLLSTQYAVAQYNWNLTVRGGANFPTKDLADADLATGYGFEGTIAYRFMPHLAVYTGWGWNTFSSDQSFAGTDVAFEETGYVFGLQFIHPIGQSKLNYLLGAGGLYNHIEVENSNGDITADSGHGLGWQVDAGLSVPVGERLNIQPTVRYRALAREIKIESTTTDVDLNYIAVGAGLSWSF